MATSNDDYHFVGLSTRYSSKFSSWRTTYNLPETAINTGFTGWTARVEAVLEYFKIQHTVQFVSLPEVNRAPSCVVETC